MSKEREQQPEPMTLASVTQIARELMLQHGDQPPMVIAIGGEKWTIGVLPEMPGTHAARLHTMRAAGYMLAQRHIVSTLDELFFITEAWASRGSVDNPITQSPTQDPNRIEILAIIHLQVQSHEIQATMHRIIRQGEQVVDLQVFERSDDALLTGRSPLLDAYVEGFWLGKMTDNQDMQ